MNVKQIVLIVSTVLALAAYGGSSTSTTVPSSPATSPVPSSSAAPSVDARENPQRRAPAG